MVRLGRLGVYRLEWAWMGVDRHGRRGVDRTGQERKVKVGKGRLGESTNGMDWQVTIR